LTTLENTRRFRCSRNRSTAAPREAFKRALDVILSAFALIVLAPLLIPVAFAIRLETPGPLIYRQKRIGRHGTPFVVLKFRTMVDGADETVHRQAIRRLSAGERLSDDPQAPFKLANDPRITRVGRWLRRTSLDEAPQLINVLRGEMSLVGPRPMIPYELEYVGGFSDERHSVRPGITGLSQVYGRGRATIDELLQLDLEYVRTSTLCMDLKLLLLTIPVIAKGVGAR
jgi:lipopolysaccharide/colanic/teichoic acid biosynthesis glycosyltransferase